MPDNPLAQGNGSLAAASTAPGSGTENEPLDKRADGESAGTEMSFQSLTEYDLQPLEWVWDGLIPRGKLTLITGEPGVGKSLFALQVAAMVTRGCRTPFRHSASVEWQAGSGPAAAVSQALVERDGRDRPGKHLTDPAGAGGGTPPVPHAESTAKAIGEPGAVLLFSADDGLADTVRPRLEAAGADIANVFLLRGESRAKMKPDEPRRAATKWRSVVQHLIKRPLTYVPETGRPDSGGKACATSRAAVSPAPGAFRVERDLVTLEENLLAFQDSGVDVRLVVIDPIDCYLHPTDRNLDLSDIVARLVGLASRSGAALLVVANSTSSGIGRTGYRSGTIGNEELANSARSVLMIVQDLECEDQRLVLPVKVNLCRQSPGLVFSIRNDALEWSSKPIPLTGDEYFLQAKEKSRNPLVREERSEINRVTRWLRQRLSHGAVSSVQVRTDAVENEIAYTTLRRAFRQLGCQATKVRGIGRWYWRLPGLDALVDADLAPDQGDDGESVAGDCERVAGEKSSQSAEGDQGVQDVHDEHLGQVLLDPEK